MALPYSISGHIFDTNGTTAINRAIVSAYNMTTGEYLPLTSICVTNSAGEYAIDCANFPNSYTNGDIIEVLVWRDCNYSRYQTTISTDSMVEEKDITTSKNSYTTTSRLSAFLQMKRTFNMIQHPTHVDICERIAEVEDMIDVITRTAWRVKTVTNEYHTLENDYVIDTGRSVRTNFYPLQTFTSGTHKIEYWNGSSWIDWVSTKTESRSGDFWINYTDGVIYMRMPFLVTGKMNDVRLTYRYGESTVPEDIKLAATMLASINIITNEDRSMFLLGGEAANISYSGKVESWKKQADEILARRTKIGVGWS